MHSRTSGIQMMNYSIKCLQHQQQPACLKNELGFKKYICQLYSAEVSQQTHFSTTKQVMAIISDIYVDIKIHKNTANAPKISLPEATFFIQYKYFLFILATNLFINNQIGCINLVTSPISFCPCAFWFSDLTCKFPQQFCSVGRKYYLSSHQTASKQGVLP